MPYDGPHCVSDAHVFLRPGTRSVLAAAFAGGSIGAGASADGLAWAAGSADGIGAETSAEDASQVGATGDDSIGGDGPAVF